MSLNHREIQASNVTGSQEAACRYEGSGSHRLPAKLIVRSVYLMRRRTSPHLSSTLSGKSVRADSSLSLPGDFPTVHTPQVYPPRMKIAWSFWSRLRCTGVYYWRDAGWGVRGSLLSSPKKQMRPWPVSRTGYFVVGSHLSRVRALCGSAGMRYCLGHSCILGGLREGLFHQTSI